MKPTTIYLAEETNIFLEQLSHKTGRSQAEIIQEAVEEYLSKQNKKMPCSIGMGASGRSDLSEQVDELLWQ